MCGGGGRSVSAAEQIVAKGTRGCKRNRAHRIPAGGPCLVIRDAGTPYTKCYCPECVLPILKQCADDLREIRDALYGPDFRPGDSTKDNTKSPKPERQPTVGEQLVAANRRRRAKPEPAGKPERPPDEQFRVTGYLPGSRPRKAETTPRKKRATG